MAGRDDTRPLPDREGAEGLMAAALRLRRPGGRLATTDKPVLDAFPDRLVTDLAVRINAVPERLVPPLAGGAAREVSERVGEAPSAAPSQVHDELAAVIKVVGRADD